MADGTPSFQLPSDWNEAALAGMAAGCWDLEGALICDEAFALTLGGEGSGSPGTVRHGLKTGMGAPPPIIA